METKVFPKLSLVKGSDGAPTVTNFKDRSTFEVKYPAYQFSKGFAVDMTLNSDRATMKCTHAGCPFMIAVVSKTFEAGKAKAGGPAPAPFIGWTIPTDAFFPDHNHPAPYEPLSLDEENERRLHPLPLDYTPPLIRRSAFRELLQTIDPTLLTNELCAEAEAIGLIDITLEELLDLDGPSLRSALDQNVPSASATAKLEIMEGWRKAGERREKGEEPSGCLGDDPEQVAQLKGWLEAKFAVA
ncbi:hypothetical protein RQP46_006513 [Phenoliferia psychrophenolica]